MVGNIMVVGSQLLISYDKIRSIDSQFYDYTRKKVVEKAFELRVVGGKKYIIYNERLKSHREKLGTREELLAEMEEELRAIKESEAELVKLNFAEGVVLKRSIYAECLKNRLNDLEANQMMRLCGWFDKIKEGDFTKQGLSWEDILLAMQAEWETGKLYGKAVENVANLKSKIKKYQEEGFVELIDGRKGNNNNSKYQNWHKAIVYHLYTEAKGKILPPTLYKSFCATALEVLMNMPIKVKPKRNFRGQILDNDSRAMSEKSLYTKLEYVNTQSGEVIQTGEMVYDKFLQKYVWQPVDFETVRKHITEKDFRIDADLYRHGSKYYNDKIAPHTRLDLPNYSLSLLTMDDYVNNFHLIKQKNGAYVASSERLTTYTIWDTATDIPLGSAHGLQYTKALVYQAIFNAMLFIKEQTGNWIAPCEVEMERMFTQGSKKVTRLQDGQDKVQRVESPFETDLKKLFQYVTLRQKPQGKLTESRQNIAQNEFFRDLQWYVGNNIQSTKPDSKANPDHKKANSINQCVTEDEVIEKWNEYREFKCKQLQPKSKGKTRLQYFLENIQPQCDILDDLAMVQIFAEHLGCVTTVAERRFELNVKGKIYAMPVSLLTSEALRNLTPEDGLYKVKYLPHDLSKIYLYHPVSNIFICEISEKGTAQRAKVEQTEEDKAIIGHGNAELARLKRHIEELRAKQEAILESFEVADILDKNNPIKTWKSPLTPHGGNTPLSDDNQSNTDGGLFGDTEPSYEFTD